MKKLLIMGAMLGLGCGVSTGTIDDVIRGNEVITDSYEETINYGNVNAQSPLVVRSAEQSDGSVCDMYLMVEDKDGDGFGIQDEKSVYFCEGNMKSEEAKDYAMGRGECDDNNIEINPGMPELCDLIDNNCDGLTDKTKHGTNIGKDDVCYRDNKLTQSYICRDGEWEPSGRCK